MVVTPIVICLNRAGEAIAREIATIMSFPLHGRAERVDKADVYFPDALDHIRELFAAGHPVIGVCASGILIRSVAPLLNDKTKEPPVLSISDDGSVVVPLLGGHRGANRLARDLAELLSGKAAVTTAGDVALGVSLDEPPAGWVLANPEDAKGAMAALLSGEGVEITGQMADQAGWLEPLPRGDAVRITCDLRVPEDTGPDHLCFVPQCAVLGLGASRSCPPEEMANLVFDALDHAGLSPKALAAIGTIDVKADEVAILEMAERFHVPLRLFDAVTLEAETPRLANPSDVVFTEVGTHSVAEAASLALAGEDAVLITPKKKSEMATAAVAMAYTPITEFKGRSPGRLAIVSTGPGQASWRTPEAAQLVAEAEELVGYGLYIDLLGPLAAGKSRADFELGSEEARCRYALERAGEGRNVALVCSGDAGIYAMAALVFELIDREPANTVLGAAARQVQVVMTPGISALQAAAARAGAPLGHDFCAISLSDLLTPREDIISRIKAAAEGDFVIAFYNPVSKRRRTLLAEARNILLEHRPADTPVLLASSLGRPEEELRYRSLSELQVEDADMLTTVLVGSSQSRLFVTGRGQHMYTPRGYAAKSGSQLKERDGS